MAERRFDPDTGELITEAIGGLTVAEGTRTKLMDAMRVMLCDTPEDRQTAAHNAIASKQRNW